MKEDTRDAGGVAVWQLPAEVTAALAAGGLQIAPEMEEQWRAYMHLLCRWNAFSGLMSAGELDRLGEHLLDALSLAPFLKAAGHWLDIGSGGGFPAIPCKILLPDVPLVLVERNGKKAGFLRKVIGALGLSGVDLNQGNFPECVRGRSFTHITARAVEKPLQILGGSRGWLNEGAEFLWQSGEIGAPGFETFHVEPVDDLWKTHGWRRGTLHRIRAAF
ncbi:MAG: class I SAM-dependent methyltransferase [Candidatus Hydrogenedentes bacterium]|nr:class I SAM-dependent methyltransferase [Candidatus Hydrogenedentota bacterium]